MITKLVSPSDGAKPSIASVDISPARKDHIFFRGTGKGNWYSTDMGNTFHYSDLNLNDVRMHPHKGNFRKPLN